jgi:hypothetical protein
MGEVRKKTAKNSGKQKKAALKATRAAKTEKRAENERLIRPEEGGPQGHSGRDDREMR